MRVYPAAVHCSLLYLSTPVKLVFFPPHISFTYSCILMAHGVSCTVLAFDAIRCPWLSSKNSHAMLAAMPTCDLVHRSWLSVPLIGHNTAVYV